MFLGHHAVGLAAKRIAPRTSLGWLLAAPILADLLWPLFLLLGWERVRIEPGNTAVTPLAFDSYPLSHSLLLTVGWAALAALVMWLFTRDGRGASVVAVLVVSHWVLDFASHRPDMPLLPAGGPKVGLGLWNSVLATVLVELALFFAGLEIYLRATKARDRRGTWLLAVYAVLMLAIYAGNLFGPPPPSARAIAFAALLLWLIPAWGWWIDRHREARATVS